MADELAPPAVAAAVAAACGGGRRSTSGENEDAASGVVELVVEARETFGFGMRAPAVRS